MNYALKGTPETPVEPGEDIVTSSVAGYKEFFIKTPRISANTYVTEEEDFKVDNGGRSSSGSSSSSSSSSQGSFGGDGGLDDIM